MYKSVAEFSPLNTTRLHIALIPDGGRRWAKKNDKSFFEAYLIMVEKIAESVEYLFEKGIDVISVYFSSIYNFKRPDSEINAFCEAESYFFSELVLPLAIRFEFSINVVGDISVLKPEMIEAIETAELITKDFSNKKLYLCVNYSSLMEISTAIDKSPNSFVNGLGIPYPVNMLIRTGNANVLSDFLLPQCAFARLFFLDKLFNDIAMDDYEELIKQYLGFELKYGE